MPTTHNALFEFRVAETGEFAGRVWDNPATICQRARKQARMRRRPIDVVHLRLFPSGKVESEFVLDTVETMPYKIQHVGPREHAGSRAGLENTLSERVVDDLHDEREVYNALYGTAISDKLGVAEQIAMMKDGGGVRALPDGTHVNVVHITWSTLCGIVGHGGSSQDPAVWQPEIIESYNKKMREAGS
jgi:hypothetical protein